ncbi:DNA-nicking Smr family endonuclease [Hasllibacter halocynthiae]|uniref:DNA-nicking Smr family endonuclease n=1 Tax=Hasllibacter halocynthiae TaxID=595589 RepID=A0A2T0X2J9_9RHOB|nr:Smr/MutS family protein [Hasllibacter halocynthiae]PRY93137.1 DNA-nicking Smr family endonuclease [Hasllibacter halocynthiae]
MSRRRRQGLSAEDRALWEVVASGVERMHPAPPRPRAPKPSPVRPAPEGPAPVPAFRVGAKAPAVRPFPDLAAPGSSPGPSPGSLAMDAKKARRLRRGALRPEARIDLHGMTLDAAHPALLGFVARAHGEGRRLVLVITGKGRAGAAAGGRGALRRQVPFWLAQGPLAALVQQVMPAHRRHGGDGALYVYLRRGR